MEHEIPKVIQKEDKRYEFEYKPEGLVFFGQESVVILDRKTGETRIVPMADIKKILTAKHHSILLSELLIFNHYTTRSHDIVGLGATRG